MASLLTGLLTAAANVGSRIIFDRWIDAKQLRLAFASEIRAVLKLLRDDDFVEFLKRQIKSMEDRRQEEPFVVFFRTNYNAVFIASASKLALPQRVGTSREVAEDFGYLLLRNPNDRLSCLS